MEVQRKPGWKVWRAPTRRETRRDWTGFGGKTLWDWLHLLSALAIPVVIAFGGWWFSSSQDERAHRVEEQRAQDAALQSYLDQMSQLLVGSQDQKGLRHAKWNDEVHTIAQARTLVILQRLDQGDATTNATVDREGAVLRFLQEANVINATVFNGEVVKGETVRVIRRHPQDQRKPKLRAVCAEVKLKEDSGESPCQASTMNGHLYKPGYPAISLKGAYLHDADLRNADLWGASLYRADLTAADLRSSILIGTLMAGAKLTGEADLSDASLIGADLTDADLTDADLTDAGLTDADLTDADLSGAKVTDDQLCKAESVDGAILPDGERPSCPTAGATTNKPR